MPFQIEWLAAAEANLQRIWLYWQQEGAALSSVMDAVTNLRSRELRAITESCDCIEQRLKRTPLTAGRMFRGQRTCRVFGMGPLVVGFDVYENERRVTVLAVSYDDRRN